MEVDAGFVLAALPVRDQRSASDLRRARAQPGALNEQRSSSKDPGRAPRQYAGQPDHAAPPGP